MWDIVGCVKKVYCITNLISAVPWIGQILIICILLFNEICLYINTIFNNKLLIKVTHTYNRSQLINNISLVHGVRNYSTSNRGVSLGKLDPDWVSGFIDGEASFTTVIYYKNRWCVNSVFKISLHKKDTELLNSIQAFFGVGRITSDSDSVHYRVERISDLVNSIITHLDKYPLISQKKADYELFKRFVFIINEKLHLTKEGLQNLVNIKASMNKGVSEVLLAEFPNTNPVYRPDVKIPEVTDIRPNWLAGFTSGDGCFFIYVEVRQEAYISNAVWFC